MDFFNQARPVFHSLFANYRVEVLRSLTRDEVTGIVRAGHIHTNRKCTYLKIHITVFRRKDQRRTVLPALAFLLVSYTGRKRHSPWHESSLHPDFPASRPSRVISKCLAADIEYVACMNLFADV